MASPKRSKKKKGVILAGGEGKRLRPLTLEIPKPLIPVKKKPLINYSVELFIAHGITDIKVIIRGQDREDYRRWLKWYGEEFKARGATIDILEETEPMGTLGFLAHHLLDWIGEDEVFVTNSDDIKDVDLTEMLTLHATRGAQATLGVYELEAPSGDYGTVLLEGDRVKGFLEKQDNSPSKVISVGVYVLSSKALAHTTSLVSSGQSYLMFEKDLFPAMTKAGTLFGFRHRGIYRDFGTLEKWQELLERF